MATLGERMREQQQAREKKTEAERLARDEASKMKAEADRRQCSGYLLGLQSKVIDAVERNIPLKAIEVKDRYAPYNALGRVTFDNPRHPFHVVWVEEMEPWLAENGLVAEFREDHDGFGERSWMTVTFQPKV